jgi:L-methionine (R)-S-oxide reductase
MKTDFSKILQQFEDLFTNGGERNDILLKTCKLLKDNIYHYDWVGFYILDQESQQLILGPYVGKPTDHTVIPVGRGVCGQVAKTRAIKLVQDVSQDENYLSCSVDVQSEIVVPVLKNDAFVAEIDIDSHSTAPFSESDKDFLTAICAKIAQIF